MRWVVGEKALKDDGLSFNEICNYNNECMIRIILPLDKLRGLENPSIGDLEKANILIYQLSTIQVKYSDILEQTKDYTIPF